MIIVVGSGLAGMLCALELAPLPCLLVTRAPLGQEASTPWAQGGIAAAVGPDDSIESHVADTLAAGDGLCDAEAVARIVGDGPAVIEA
ncbi:FAD-binding protein, partial [Endobacter medicaginis]